jgi:phosphoglycerate dehydrogenase-like enzyme
MLILIPDTIALDVPSGPDTYLVYDAAAPFDARHAAAELLVTWGNSAANFASATRDLPRLRVVQTLNAGPDQALGAGFAPHIQICSGRTLHDGPVTEHTLGMILALQRRLPELVAAQQRHEWLAAMVPAQADPATRQQYTLSGARVVILGYGSIATTLTPHLRALGATVEGIATTGGLRGDVMVHAWADRAAVVGRADVVVSILPHVPATDRICDAAFFALLRRNACFVNVGRGKTVDETALDAALRAGQFRAAAIDVTAIEPLPADSPLWSCPNLFITPHVAGGRPIGGAALVQEQVAALHAGTPLRNVAQR